MGVSFPAKAVRPEGRESLDKEVDPLPLGSYAASAGDDT
jgi:hypothetical protein